MLSWPSQYALWQVQGFGLFAGFAGGAAKPLVSAAATYPAATVSGTKALQKRPATAVVSAHF